MLTIVPALLEKRELWVFDRDEDGRWQALAEPLVLATDVLSLEATDHPAVPLLALTDGGFEAIVLSAPAADSSPRPAEPATRQLERQPLITAETALAGTAAFLPGLRWVYHLDDDRWPDLLLPTAAGWQVHSGTASGFAQEASQLLAAPSFKGTRTPWRQDLPLPEVRDADGDGRPEILIPHPLDGWRTFYLYRNRGGRFDRASGPFGARDRAGEDASEPRVVFFDDLDGDGRADYVTQQELPPDDDAGMRKEMAHAKRPPHTYRLYDATADLGPAPKPRRELTTIGYSFPGDSGIRLPGGLWDLDGDGRRDLVTLTLDFSMLQAVRVLVARSISIGLDFHVLCQQADGSFEPVAGLDLSGRFRLNLNNFRQGQLSLFDGDFDGDGRKDFVQIGRGDRVAIHRGASGCRFPNRPDLEIDLVAAPKDLALVSVADLDGDGLSDLSIVQPQRRKKRQRGAVESAPVRLDLYLSAGGSN